MLLRRIAGKSTKEVNKHQVESIPEFKCLTDQQLDYVILFTDYESILRNHKEKKRKFLAALTAGYKLEKGRDILDMNGRNVINGSMPLIEAAIAKYKELQPNKDLDAAEVIETQIDNITSLVMSEKVKRTKAEEAQTVYLPDAADLKKINDLVLSLPDLRASVKKLQISSGVDFAVTVEDEQGINEKKPISLVDQVNMEEESKKEDGI